MTPGDDRDDTFMVLQEALAGRWSLESELGRGGMATVYLARDVALDRPVAIKVLHPALASRLDQRERFLREARTGARLSHPHIVPIYAVGEAAGLVYFVMGFVDGESVATRIRRQGPLDAAEAEGILRETGWALGYAHAMGVLHRDITLDNILLERTTGRAVLVDFGIAAEMSGDGDVALVGTPAVIAPELLHGTAPSVRSDLYALGVTGWAMLAGRYPYVGDDAAAILLQHATAPVPSLDAAAPAVSRRLAAAIEGCLAKDPDARPESVEAFVASLARRQDQHALAPALQRWLARDHRSKPLWAFACSMVALTTVGPAIDWLWYGDPLREFPAFAWRIALVFGATTLFQAALRFGDLRRVLRAGYTLEDLTAADRSHARARRQSAPTAAGALVRTVVLASIGLVGITMVFMRHDRQLWSILGARTWNPISRFISEAAGWLWITMWAGFGASLLVPVEPYLKLPRLDLAARFRRTRAAQWLARLATWGTPRDQAVEHTLHRPTELVLDLAIEQLWAALPDATRADLDALPRIAAGLRARAGDTRELLEQLDCPGPASSPEAVALRDRLVERRRSAVTALEQLRLQLASLASEAAPSGELTGHLRDARALEAELLTGLGADADLVRRLRVPRPPTPRNFTPTPTPTPRPT